MSGSTKLEDNYKIMVFTWNTKSIPLENFDKNQSILNFFPFSNMISSILPNPIEADFFPALKEEILLNSPDIFVIGFQEDRKPGSYFHSYFLPNKMKEIDYKLLKRTRLMGIGLTTMQGINQGDFFQRGLRISVYCKKNLYETLKFEEREMCLAMGNEGQSYYYDNLFFSKGAIVSYLVLPKIGRIAFICCHLPFDSSSLIKAKKSENNFLRQNAINISNVCLNKIIEELVLSKDCVPNHVILFGDLNYRVSNTIIKNNSIEDLNLNLMYSFDELKSQMNKENIFSFSEGIDNKGPSFLPTSKLNRFRQYKWGKFMQRIPSWCDRILYAKFKEEGNPYNLSCKKYERFDRGYSMSLSDHAAVYGIYDFVKT